MEVKIKKRPRSRNDAQTQERRKARFLAAIARAGTITGAARLAKVNRKTVFRWRQDDETFDGAIYEAQEPIYDELEEIGLDRARNKDGRYDERTSFLYWIAILKSRRTKFRDSFKPTVDRGPVHITFNLPEREGIKRVALPEHFIEGEITQSDG